MIYRERFRINAPGHPCARQVQMRGDSIVRGFPYSPDDFSLFNRPNCVIAWNDVAVNGVKASMVVIDCGMTNKERLAKKIIHLGNYFSIFNRANRRSLGYSFIF